MRTPKTPEMKLSYTIMMAVKEAMATGLTIDQIIESTLEQDDKMVAILEAKRLAKEVR